MIVTKRCHHGYSLWLFFYSPDKYGITVNDPNVISQVINQKTGIAEKKLYENLVHHFNRKSVLKEEVQKHVESL